MDTIKRLLGVHVKDIEESGRDPMTALGYRMYEIIRDFILPMVDGATGWMSPNSKLALLGGIHIHCDGRGTDLFIPLMFQVRGKSTAPEDLLLSTFAEYVLHNPYASK